MLDCPRLGLLFQPFLAALLDLTLTALTGSVSEVDETWFSEAADEFLATWTLLRALARRKRHC